ncbi:MAG: hypothetical protein WDZ85_01130 [Candidatus Paceibacterota bacterium]
MDNIIWRSRANVLLGLVVAALPFLGLPQNLKSFLFVALGLLIALFGFAKSHYALNHGHDQGGEQTDQAEPTTAVNDTVNTFNHQTSDEEELSR